MCFLKKMAAGAGTLLAALLSYVAGGAALAADAYPSRPVRLVVPYPPGGSPDLVARGLAAAAAGELGVPIVVENRAGANGMVATDFVAHSAGDGYTLLLGSDGPIVITPLLKGESPLEPTLHLAPVTLVGDSSFVVLAPPGAQARTLGELIAFGREHPGKLTYGSSGVGSQHHLAGLMLSNVGRMQMVHVPYKGFGEAVTDLAAARLDVLFGSVPAGAPLVTTGRLKALAVTGKSRSALLPDVATTAEQGYPQLAVSAWYGVMAPTTTPATIVNRLDTAFRSALASGTLKASLTGMGLEVLAADSQGFAARIRKDRLRWAVVIKASGVKLE
ncbi:Bug family tripartite tricarboxylate transporter substrate binding protein [Ramlibacter sp. AN1133]|uniref:Bug family tripartite tricarboxylate transporter substrate binding protein n=1 Tax=Ramlibacter sp. AN1133 TaxID=3133429 RepID=UPI0030BEB819